MSIRDRAQLKKKAGMFISAGGSVDHGYQNLIGATAQSVISTQETPKVLFTINHVDKKLKGFIDFDLQLNRPEIPPINAHDQRFEPFNHFPANYSNTHIPRQVNFDQYPGRDGALYKVNMSEPLFDREKHLNLIKPKAKGIL